ncbi:MAG: glutathione S-transferase family protein, partial [Marinicella sp.]
LLEHQSDEVYFPEVVKLMYLQDDLSQPDAMQAIDACSNYYQLMERRLADNEFIAGQYSYADIAFFMAQLFGERMGAMMNQQTPNLLKWRKQMASRPAVKTALKPMVKFLHGVNRPVPNYIDQPNS